MRNGSGNWVYVWDPFVRAFHWILVVGFAVAYFTGEEILGVHVWAGYAVGVLIVSRFVWGFVGPSRARFSDFVSGPVVTLRYLQDLLLFRAKRYIGHSPAGGAMIILLLLFISATVASGLVLYGTEKNGGPLAGLISSSAAQRTVQSNVESDDEILDQENRSENGVARVAKETHELFANLSLLLIVLHIGAVIFASIAHRENLVRAMLTGFKRR
jgi:cytochrome b